MAADEAVNGDVDARRPVEDESAAGQEDSALQDEPSPRFSGGAKLTGATSALVVVLLIVLCIAGLAGWLGYRARQSNQANEQRAVLLETARQAAVNLTTISYTEVDADIKRITDSAIGKFHDDFQQRSPAFIDVVKQVQSKSIGTVTAAGLESVSGDEARALVTVSVKTSNAGAAEEQPRAWRIRISVAKDRDGAKVSDVQFVP